MKEVIKEYAETIIGVVGSMGLFLLLKTFFYGKSGFIAQLIQIAVTGGN